MPIRRYLSATLLAAVLALAGCEPAPTPNRPAQPQYTGGPMPAHEASLVAQRCAAALPSDEDEPRLRAQFVAAVETLLAAADTDSRVTAAGQLGQFRQPAANDALLLALEDPQRKVRVAAIDALGWIGTERVAPTIAVKLRDPAVDVRLAAAETLGRLANPQTATALRDATNDPDDRVKAAAALALARSRTSIAQARLPKLLADPSPKVRSAAAAGLGVLADPSAIDPLLSSLRDDPSALVRYQAANALGRIGDPRATVGLVEARKDPDPSVQKAARSALERMKK